MLRRVWIKGDEPVLVCGSSSEHPPSSREDGCVCEEVNMSFRSKTDLSSDVTGAKSTDHGRDVSGKALSARAERMKRVSRASLSSFEATNEDRRVSAPVEEPRRTLDAWPLPGLAPMTRVRTSFGDVHAAALRKGDEVLTRSGEYAPILWLTRIRLDEQILAEKPDTSPVVIAAGALGPGLPSQEIMVSPRQIICADPTSGLANNHEAASLVTRPGVRRVRETCLSYTMFHVGRPVEVYCEGAFLVFPMDA